MRAGHQEINLIFVTKVSRKCKEESVNKEKPSEERFEKIENYFYPAK